MQRYNLFFRTKNEKQRNLSALLLLLIYIKSYSQQAYSVWKWTITWQFSAFLPHITRNHFSKGKNTGSTYVSKTFIQRGYKSIIKSISKYIITWVRRPLRRSPRSLEFVNSHHLCVLRVRLASVSHHLSSRCGFNPHRQNISEIRNGISWVFLWKS